jgi:ribonuclease P protein component
MLTKEQRLQKEKDITHVLALKEGVFDDVCGVRFARNGLGFARVAFSVGKKVSLLAVDRNRVRRQFRALYKETAADWPQGVDYVFLVGKQALRLSYADKRQKFLAVLRKVQKRLA